MCVYGGVCVCVCRGGGGCVCEDDVSFHFAPYPLFINPKGSFLLKHGDFSRFCLSWLYGLILFDNCF
jgi:hypothetical protein